VLTAKKAAAKLGVNASRVRQFILAKRLPAQKFGNAWAIDENDLKRLVRYKRGRPPKTQEPA